MLQRLLVLGMVNADCMEVTAMPPSPAAPGGGGVAYTYAILHEASITFLGLAFSPEQTFTIGVILSESYEVSDHGNG